MTRRVVYLLQGAYDEGYGTVLDSGTTFTYLPTSAFVPFLAAVKRFAIARGLHITTGPDKAVRILEVKTVNTRSAVLCVKGVWQISCSQYTDSPTPRGMKHALPLQ